MCSLFSFFYLLWGCLLQQLDRSKIFCNHKDNVLFGSKFQRISLSKSQKRNIRFDVDSHWTFGWVTSANHAETQTLFTRSFLVRNRVDKKRQRFGSFARNCFRRISRIGHTNALAGLAGWKRLTLRVSRPRPTMRFPNHHVVLWRLLDRGQGCRPDVFVMAGWWRRRNPGSWSRRWATFRRERRMIHYGSTAMVFSTATGNYYVHVFRCVLKDIARLLKSDTS